MKSALLASRLSTVQPSATDAVSQLARKLAREGRSIINLSIGEPDVNTPDHVKRAAIAAIERNETKYTAVPGTLELREAISAKFWRENGLVYPEDQVTIGCGGKQVIYNAFIATLDPGDEVIVPAPYWLSYPDMVSLAGGTPVILPTLEDDGFKLRPEALEAAITSRTKWVVLNSPSNPTGAVYGDEELRAVLEVLVRHPKVLLLADDLYEHLIYDGTTFTSCAKLEPRLLSRTLTLNGVSKAYAMTGWRVGYAGGPADLIRAINTVQSQTATHTSSISQAAAVAALSGPLDFVLEYRDRLQARRDLIVDGLNAAGLTCQMPQGAFYVFPSVVNCIGAITPSGHRIENDTDFAAYLLEAEGVAVIPGAAFGASSFVRISYAAPTRTLEDAVVRIARACKNLDRVEHRAAIT